MKKSNNRFAVTEIVKMSRCETLVQLDYKYGKYLTNYANQRRLEGIKEHADFEKEPVDGRCFVATSIFGFYADETKFLRQYRDDVLLSNIFGRFLVQIYYSISPWLIKIFPYFLLKIIRFIVVFLLPFLGYKKQ